MSAISGGASSLAVAIQMYGDVKVSPQVVELAEMPPVSSTLPLAAVLLAVAASSQTQPTKARPQFDVASVKLNTSGARAVSIGSPSPGTFNAENVWLRFLIQTAWNVKDSQLSGGPGWATTDRYDIKAKAATGADFEEMKPMLQSLLEDRFQLTLHRESKALPVYVLVVGKGSAKLKVSKEGACAASQPDASQSPSTPRQTVPICGTLKTSPRSITGTRISMAQFAAALSSTMHRTVADETGLTELFDVDLGWTADQSTPGFWAPGLGQVTGSEPSSDSGGSIFTLIQEELGLKIESATRPVMMLVIDHAAKPSAN